jgi:transposase
MKTHVGVDLHQRFCYVTAVDASGRKYGQGQVVNEAGALRAWLRQLPGPRQVVVEASGFWPAFARAVGPEAERLVMVHPQRVKAIASARLKNDRVDSATLAHLSRAELLPEAWMASEATQQLRMLTRMRMALGQQRSRAKNQLQAVLHQEGFLKPVSDLFGKRGRVWLSTLPLSACGRVVVDTWLREVDHLDALIADQTRELERLAGSDARARWLCTVPGIGPYSAMVILAEIGDIERFHNKRALASYAGLTPSVRESAGRPEARRHRASRIGNAALDPAAGGPGRGPLLARGPRLDRQAAPAQARAGGQDRPRPQTAHRGLGHAATWRVFPGRDLRRQRITPPPPASKARP